jgi:hypothetical protein
MKETVQSCEGFQSNCLRTVPPAWSPTFSLRKVFSKKPSRRAYAPDKRNHSLSGIIASLKDNCKFKLS